MAPAAKPEGLDPPTARVRSAMRRQRRRDTQPELALRRALHGAGLRYRVQDRVPGCPRRSIDISFRTERIAVFVQGCFWHGCRLHKGAAKSNDAWWEQKLAGNAARDADTDQRLIEQGWLPVRVWEHEPVDQARDRILEIVAARRGSSGGRFRGL